MTLCSVTVQQSLTPNSVTMLRDQLQRATGEDKRLVLEYQGTRILPSPDGNAVELSVPEAGQITVATIPGFPAEGLRPVLSSDRSRESPIPS